MSWFCIIIHLSCTSNTLAEQMVQTSSDRSYNIYSGVQKSDATSGILFISII